MSAEQLERWFQEYYGAVFRFFANRGFDHEECRDLTQETFVAAYRGRKQFRGDASVATWIFSIAKNLWKNKLRRAGQQKRQSRLVPLDGDCEYGNPAPIQPRSDDQGPLELLLDTERMDRLRQALDALPSQMRHCAYLRYGQHLKYAEIAKVLRVSVDTVKSHLFQANQRIRQALAEHFPEIESPRDRGDR